LPRGRQVDASSSEVTVFRAVFDVLADLAGQVVVTDTPARPA
jgi:hypothetical protein